MEETKKLIECVPNFSEGRDESVIQKITDAVRSVEGIKLLHTDTGKAANRTVVTFVGAPDAVVEGAFRAIKVAAENIDMSVQKGEHPRIGATDVCPLIPVANITMDETIEYSRLLGKRVGAELNIPVYLYEASASVPERKNLATIRSGEYEGLEAKMLKPEWRPDFGDGSFNAKSGATVIGARDFLIAYNININSKSAEIANAIAGEVRESGRLIPGSEGQMHRVPGSLKAVKAIGWFIKDFDVAQISINIINFRITPFHIVFEEVSRVAKLHGVEVTGSELVGLIPLQAMADAGKFYGEKYNLPLDLSEEDRVNVAVKYMGLNQLYSFDPRKKIIDYLL